MMKGLHNTAKEFLVLTTLEMKFLVEMVAHPYNPMTQKTKADDRCSFGVSLCHAVVLGQPQLQSKIKQKV